MYEQIEPIQSRTVRLTWLTALTGLLALASAGCSSALDSRVGTVQVYLAATTSAEMISSLVATDPPLVDVASAEVTISRVELVPGRVLVTDFGGTPQTYDLLDLDDGVIALLGETTIPVGDYSQLRLIVDGASVTLGSGETFELRVPSGMQTGIKVNFGEPVNIEPGVTQLVAVFDVSRSFVTQGPPSAPRSVSFKPVIHASVLPAASIEGNVSLPSAAPSGGTPVLIEALLGTDVVSTATATVAAGGTGPAAYTLGFLPPGDYVVRASASGFQAAEQNVTVAVGAAVTGVNLTLGS